jgi:coproporphyrinogen III oxidase-like Fe-S oxidoreductase
MLGLRTSEGIGFEKMERRYGESLRGLAPASLAKCIEHGMLTERAEGVVATSLGWRYLDAVLRSLLAEMRSNLDTVQV